MTQKFELPRVSIGDIAGRLLSVGLPLGAVFLAFSMMASGPWLDWFTTAFLMSGIAFSSLTRAALRKESEPSRRTFVGFVFRVLVRILRAQFLTNPFTLRVIGAVLFGVVVATVDSLVVWPIIRPFGVSLGWSPAVIGLTSLGVVLMGTYFAVFYFRLRGQDADSGSQTWAYISDEYEQWRGRPLRAPALELGRKQRALLQAAGQTLLTLIVRAFAIWAIPLVFADWRGGLSFLLALLTAAVAPEYVVAVLRYALSRGDTERSDNSDDSNPNERNAS